MDYGFIVMTVTIWHIKHKTKHASCLWSTFSHEQTNITVMGGVCIFAELCFVVI